MPYFGSLLSNPLLSHRYNKPGKEKYLFKHRIELWNTFESIDHLTLVDDKTLSATDLLNYFEQISIDTVENAFIGMIADIDTVGGKKNTIRSAVTMLRACLERWHGTEPGHPGIQQIVGSRDGVSRRARPRLWVDVREGFYATDSSR